MKTKPSALLPILRSEAVGELLARLFVHPQRAWVLKDLAAEVSVSLPTATREVSRMVLAGLVTEARVGRTRQVRANVDSKMFGPLRPVPVLEDELRGINVIEQDFIYGSWAARQEGQVGHEPNDVDVLTVGEADPDLLYDAADRAQARLGRPVSIRRVSPSAWHEGSPDPFLQNVRAGAMVPLTLGGE